MQKFDTVLGDWVLINYWQKTIALEKRYDNIAIRLFITAGNDWNTSNLEEKVKTVKRMKIKVYRVNEEQFKKFDEQLYNFLLNQPNRFLLKSQYFEKTKVALFVVTLFFRKWSNFSKFYEKFEKEVVRNG